MTAEAPQRPNALEVRQEVEDTAKTTHSESPDQAMVNVFTLARRFNVHHRTAQRWTKNKWIPHYRVGRLIRYNLSEVLSSTASGVQ
jgi:excisionase family DNA binding protein